MSYFLWVEGPICYPIRQGATWGWDPCLFIYMPITECWLTFNKCTWMNEHVNDLLKWKIGRWMLKVLADIVRAQQINERVWRTYFLGPGCILCRVYRPFCVSRLLIFTGLQSSMTQLGSFSNQSNWPRFDILRKGKFLTMVLSCLENNHSSGFLTMAVTCSLGLLRIVFGGNRDMDPLHVILATFT